MKRNIFKTSLLACTALFTVSCTNSFDDVNTDLYRTKEELAQKKQTLSLAVQTLLELGMSNDVIAEKLSISKDIVEEIRRN